MPSLNMKHSQRTTRRRFIAAASLAAGVPFISRLSWAAGSPLQKLQYAAIGVGGRGAADINSMSGHKKVQMVAAADVDQSQLNDFKCRWEVKALYTDYREMVEKEHPDIVCLTTRPEPRAEVTIGLAEMGIKAIFATKPMCRTLAEADAMIEACRKHGTILSIACHLNWYGYYTLHRNNVSVFKGLKTGSK